MKKTKQKGGLGETSIESSSSTSGMGGKALAAISLSCLLIFGFVILNNLTYFFPFSSTNATSLSPSPSPSPSTSPSFSPFSSSSPSSSYSGQQVFNIPKNKYTYQDAQAMCKAFNARLATYDEIEQSYNDGGEWCSYGWSENQLALFPTQKSTYASLQKIKGHENDCGRPGVNGGYMANNTAKFGVNCYGVKPDINQEEQEKLLSASLYPKSQEDIEFDKRTEYWKGKIPEILLSPFNKTTWSII